jgi:hypothetical protein
MKRLGVNEGFGNTTKRMMYIFVGKGREKILEKDFRKRF